MPQTTSHAIPITEAAYVNVSNGNIAVSLVVESQQRLRLVFGDDNQPAVDTPDYIALNGPVAVAGRSFARGVFHVTDLDAEDDLWVRSDSGPTTIRIIRGSGTIATVG